MIALNLIQITSGSAEIRGEQANSVERLSRRLNRIWEWVPGVSSLNRLWEHTMYYAPNISPVAWEKGMWGIIPGTLSNLLSWSKKPSVILSVCVTAFVVYKLYNFFELYRMYMSHLESSQHFQQGAYQLALDSGHILLERAKRANNRLVEATAYSIFGTIHQRLNNFHEAIKFHEKDLAIAKTLRDRVKEGRPYTNLGIAHHSLGHYSRAIEFHEEALAIAEIMGDRDEKAKVYINIGNVYQARGEYLVAIEFYEKYFDTKNVMDDPVEEATVYGNLGIAHRSLSNYSQASEYHKKALAVAVAMGSRFEEGRAYINLGCVHLSLDDFPKAIDYQEKALEIALALGDREGEGKAYTNLGIAHNSLGNNSLAFEYHAKALEIAFALMDRGQERRAYTGYGYVHQSLGNYLKAIEFHEKALTLAIKFVDQTGECEAYAGLGIAYENLGDYSCAIKFHQKHLVVSLALGDQKGEGNAYTNLGNVHQSLHNYPLAIDYHEKSVALAKILGDQAGESRAYVNCGNAYQSLGNYALAIEYYNKRLVKARTFRDRNGEGIAYGNLGSAYASIGDYTQAIECHKECLRIGKSVGDQKLIGGTYTNLGNIRYLLDDYPVAIEFYKRALAVAEELGASDSIACAYSNLGKVYSTLEDYASAEKYFQEGIRTFSRIQHSLNEMYHSKITIFEDQSTAYFGLEYTFLRQGKHKNALIISDSRRSRSLNDRIRAKLKVPIDSSEPLTSIEEMQKFARKLGTTFVVYRFDPHKGIDRKFGIWIIHPEREIVYRSIEIPKVLQAIKKNAITPFQDMEFPQVRRGGENLFEDLFAGLPGQELVAEAEKEQIAFLQDWYNELIAPIRKILPDEGNARITIVPDGPLMDLPFALLMDPDGNYLFESYTISITPSIKALNLLTQRQMLPSDKSLIVGNPIAPNMNPLPNASIEAARVAEVTGTSQEQTFIEGEASKTAILAQLENSRFIHFACHGYPKAKDRLSIYDGAFYLTPDEQSPEGILYAEEIVECDLNTELVFLSACHSGKGRQQKEGVIGPVRSFLAAGAQSVIATLWQLPDSLQTVEMIRQFYEHILGTSEAAEAEGRALDKDEALREVMRMAASGRARYRPWEWGAFFITGYLQDNNFKT